MTEHRPRTPQQVCKDLEADGWILRNGKGDHRNYNKPYQRFVITVDMGVREIPIGTLRSIYRKAGGEIAGAFGAADGYLVLGS
jgi:predicted RNA binding protein YcfA (HicA-like mRNA interferase family)